MQQKFENAEKLIRTSFFRGRHPKSKQFPGFDVKELVVIRHQKKHTAKTCID